MCRLFAYLASSTPGPDPDQLRTFLDAYSQLAKTGNVMPDKDPGHQDGWGMAYLSCGEWDLAKESTGISMPGSGFARISAETVAKRPEIVVAHMRKASKGSIRPVNSHPFLYGGLVFCHNGDVSDEEKLGRFDDVQGSTDSERYFRYLEASVRSSAFAPVGPTDTASTEKEMIRERQVAAALSLEQVDKLRAAISALRESSEHTSLTMLLAGADTLIAYREYEHGHAKYDASVLGAYYTLYVHARPGGVVFASEPLGDAVWDEVRDRELIIAKSQKGIISREIV